MEKEVQLTLSGGMLTARLCSEIDHHVARTIRESIDSELALRRPQSLVLDFSDVKFMDSSGIALIIGRAEACAQMNATVRIFGATPQLMRLIRLSGIEKIKNVYVEQK